MKAFSLSLLWAITLPLCSCDFCSVTNSGPGIDLNGQGLSSQVGIGHMYKYIQLDNPNEITTAMHLETIDLHGTYMPHERIAISAVLPYIWQLRRIPTGNTTVSGPGDLYFNVTALLLDRTSQDTTRFWQHKLYAGAGLEMPTGKYLPFAGEGMASQSILIGSDSWDPSFSIHYQALAAKMYFYAGAGARINTENKKEFKLGNAINGTVATGYSDRARGAGYILSAGLRADHYQKNTNHGFDQKYSGGNELSVIYGMQWTFWKMRASLMIQNPLYQRLSSNTMKSPISTQTTIDFIF